MRNLPTDVLRNMVAFQASMKSGEVEILGPIDSPNRVPCLRSDVKYGPTGGRDGQLRRMVSIKRRACARSKDAMQQTEPAVSDDSISEVVMDDDPWAPYAEDIAAEVANNVLTDEDIAFYKGYADPDWVSI